MALRAKSCACVVLALLIGGAGAISPSSARAEDPVPDPIDDAGFGSIFLQRLAAPLRADGLGLLELGALSGIVGEDLENPRRETAFLEYPLFEPVSDIGNGFGAGETLAGAGLLLWTAGAWGGQGPTSELGRDMLATLAAVSLHTWSLKLAFRSTRPNGGPHSFPSGHTAAAFATATVLSRHLGAWGGRLAYAAATMTAAARMEDNRHYFRDVAFGAALGMAVGGVRVPGAWTQRLFRHLEFGGQGVAIEFPF